MLLLKLASPASISFLAVAMAHNTPPPPRTLQALILSTLVLLVASTVDDHVVGTPEPQPPSGCRRYRFQLNHVDANLSLSSDELMRRAFDRSRLRAATLYGTAADDSPPAAAAGGSSDSDSDSNSPVGSPGKPSTEYVEYFIKFFLGQQTDHVISAVVDSGSSLIWTTMDECKRSRTKSVVFCSDDKCKRQANTRCRGATHCTYDITYGDKDTQTKTAAGTLYKDKVTFPLPRPLQTFKDIAIGCTTSTTVKYKGVVGLGRGPQSLPGQLGFNKFSYCLSSYYEPDLPSYLLLETAPRLTTGARSGAAVATTGLRRDDKTGYFVDLQGISIDGETRIPVTVGKMLVDTGTSFTKLGEKDFDQLVGKLDVIMKSKNYNNEPSENGSVCYSSSSPNGTLPQMTLHFAGSADMVLPSNNYFWKTPSKLCLAIEKRKTEGMSILGNFQMQGIHMLLDAQTDKLSFVHADCSKV